MHGIVIDRPTIIARLVELLIRGYQRAISPMFPSSCRFHPTCSEYAREAVVRFGALRGGWLAAKRIGKCHPFHPGGIDPVPSHDEASAHHHCSKC
jgi:uncharacterized protein